jgi:hypothetical protein
MVCDGGTIAISARGKISGRSHRTRIFAAYFVQFIEGLQFFTSSDF